MPFSNYTELQTSIQSFLDNNNPNLIAAIPDMIALAESRIGRGLHVREMERRVEQPLVPTGATDPERGIYTLPVDWAGHQTVSKPGETIRILYWQKLPALTVQNDTNWLLTGYPDLYLYTALVCSNAWLKDDSRMDYWEKKSLEAMETLKQRDSDDKTSGNVGRIRTSRDKFWSAYSPNSVGTLTYLPPRDFFDLEENSPASQGIAGWFTVSEDKLRIWPKPGADPSGTAGWVDV